MNLHLSKIGNGPALVFFHGWGFDSQIWRVLIPSLSQDYEVYLVDLPGFGLSEYQEWKTFKEKLLDQLPNEFALAGWSLGGLYATRLAIEEPQRITHLINIASSPHFMKQDNWPGIDRFVLDKFYDKLLDDPRQTVVDFIALQSRSKFVSECKFSTEGLEQGLQVLATWDFRQLLKQWKKPTCYMFGRLDAIIPNAILATMQMDYPAFHYTFFQKAAHMPFLSHSKEFITQLKGFLR